IGRRFISSLPGASWVPTLPARDGLKRVQSAYGTPSVVLFGPTSPAEWGPPEDARHPGHLEGQEGKAQRRRPGAGAAGDNRGRGAGGGRPPPPVLWFTTFGDRRQATKEAGERWLTKDRKSVAEGKVEG